MYKFCVIMVVKNEACFVEQAVRSVLARSDCVVYAVDDCSDDNTYEILESLACEFKPRIVLRRNHLTGKVPAYQSIKYLPKSEFILFLDGDDYFNDLWSYWQPKLEVSCIYYYDLCVLSETNSASVLINPKISKMDRECLLRNLILLPKASWLIPSELVEDFLQIPEGVEFEDFWFSLTAYMLANDIRYIEEKWYVYRQHDQQTYGQLHRGGKDLFEFRGKRILKSIKAVRANNSQLANLLAWQVKRYEALLTGNFSKIFHELGVKEAAVHFMRVYTPNLLGSIKKLIRMRVK